MRDMRYMGIDYGTRKVGIALSDEGGIMGFPHSIVHNDKKLVSHVRALLAAENVQAIVIGESRNLHGGSNPVAEGARTFASRIKEESGLPVFFESEFFTTQEARRDPEGVWQSGKSAPAVDASAAALILTSYLTHHGNARRTEED